MAIANGGASTGRRQTLGVLTASQVNVARQRSSLGLLKPRNSLARLSMSSSNRRTSMFGQRAPTTVTDPRPIGSKAYQQDNIRALIKFLTLHHYDREISPKILFTPSRNDFVHIVTFLLRHIDPNFNFDQTSQNWSDDFPVFFEALGYPFKISKRSLLSVGSPHTWPALLAALVWLIDLLTYLKAIEASPSSLDESAGEKVFYGYLSTAYTKFLDGADNFSFMETNLADQFKEKNQVVQNEVEAARREIEDLQKEISELQSTRNSLSEAQDRTRALTADVSKFEKLVADLEEYKRGVVQSRTDAQEQLEGHRAALMSAEAEEAALRDQLSKQEMSAVDVSRITSERQLLQQTMTKLTADLEQIKSKQWSTEMEIVASSNALEQSGHAYRQAALQCCVLPAGTAKYAYGIDYSLVLDLSADTVEAILGPSDLKKTIKPALRKLKESMSKTLRKQAVEKRRAMESLSAARDLRAERADEVSSLQGRLAKLEQAYRDQRDLKNSELKERVARIEDLELEMASLSTSQSAGLADSEAALQAAQADLSRRIAQTQAEQCALRDHVTATMEELATHKVRIATQLAELDDLAQSLITA